MWSELYYFIDNASVQWPENRTRGEITDCTSHPNMSSSNKYSTILPSQSLPNLINSLADVEKGRSGLPQPSNPKGLRENEDTDMLAKTISVCSSVPDPLRNSLALSAKQDLYANKSQTPPIQPSPLSGMYAPGNESEGTQNSFQKFHKEAIHDLNNSLFGATIMAGDKQMKGDFSYQKLETLADLDLPPHIEDFKQQYYISEQSRVRFPLLTQLSPRTRKKISLLPKSTEQEQEKIAEYGQIAMGGKPKASKRKASESSLANRTLDFQEINNSSQSKSKINKHAPLFKQLGDVILKKRNVQYLKNSRSAVGKHPAPVVLSDQVKALSKLEVNRLHDDSDNNSQYDNLTSDATKVSTVEYQSLLLLVEVGYCPFHFSSFVASLVL